MTIELKDIPSGKHCNSESRNGCRFMTESFECLINGESLNIWFDNDKSRWIADKTPECIDHN
jgi:hypothetical protein